MLIHFHNVPDEFKRLKLPLREKLTKIDHAFFQQHPDVDEYYRELISSEFEGQLETLPANKKWIVQVSGFFDPTTRECLMRTRIPVEIRLLATADNGIMVA